MATPSTQRSDLIRAEHKEQPQLQCQGTLATINAVDEARQHRSTTTQWDSVACELQPRVLSGSDAAPSSGFDGGGGVRAAVLALMEVATTTAAEVIQGAVRRWVRRRRLLPQSAV